MALSKTLVNKAGEYLAETYLGRISGTPTRRQRHPHRQRMAPTARLPVGTLRPGLGNWVKAESSIDIKPAQRMKRLPRIIEKLARNPGMNLARMQDIGGARAVLGDPQEVASVAQRIRDYWDVRGERPADKVGTTGYRALHLIVAKPDPEAGDRLMEVQLRTQYQHLWAEDVEHTGERLGFALQGRRRSA